MKKTSLITLAILCLASSARAMIIDLGRIEFSGDFTLNHSYNFNQQFLVPFGTFGAMTLEDVSGIFAPTTDPDDILKMSSPVVAGTASGIPLSPIIFDFGNFSFDTQRISISGPDSGRHVFGFTDMSFRGFDLPDVDFGLVGLYSYWDFIAPPHEITELQSGTVDLTGPIRLQLHAKFNDGRPSPVPDTGSTLLLFSMSLAGLIGGHKLFRASRAASA